MRDIKVASRYAKSLLKIAIEENAMEALHNDMVLVNTVCNQNRDLELLLKSPIVKSDKKEQILTAVFDKQLSKIASTFIALIIRKKREGILNDIAAAFIDAYKLFKHIKTAQVTTAVTLTKTQKDQITALLNAANSEAIDLHEKIDESIIGGMILRVGDKQIDESIKRKLINLEMEFDENPYVKEY